MIKTFKKEKKNLYLQTGSILNESMYLSLKNCPGEIEQDRHNDGRNIRCGVINVLTARTKCV